MEPLLFNEDNHLIGTRTGDGSHSTNQQPNTSSRRASLSSCTYPIRGRARTRILCSGYNVRLKTRREAKIRPLKKKLRSTNTLPTTSHKNLYSSGRDWSQHKTPKNFMYADYIQLLRNINKHARANWFINTSEAQKTNLEDSRKSHHNIQRRAYHSRQSPTDSPVRGQEVGETRSPGRRGLTFMTWSPVIYELSRFI